MSEPMSASRVNDAETLYFPQPTAPLRDHQDDVTWAQWMDEMAPRLDMYYREHDSPESRLEGKPSRRFCL